MVLDRIKAGRMTQALDKRFIWKQILARNTTITKIRLKFIKYSFFYAEFLVLARQAGFI